jgi:hypothetical protein
MPAIPEDQRRAARASAESRYKQFVEHVVQQFAGGERFIDDVPREGIADDAELASVTKKNGWGLRLGHSHASSRSN